MNLSKEAKQAIEDKASILYWSEERKTIYSDGATEALTNPEIYEKTGLISLEDAMGFAEWVDVKACFLAVNHWCIHGEISDGCTYTTPQLFQIYKQQK